MLSIPSCGYSVGVVCAALNPESSEQRLGLQPLHQLCNHSGVVIRSIKPQTKPAGRAANNVRVQHPVAILSLIRKLEGQLNGLVQPDVGVIGRHKQSSPGGVLDLPGGYGHSPFVNQYG